MVSNSQQKEEQVEKEEQEDADNQPSISYAESKVTIENQPYKRSIATVIGGIIGDWLKWLGDNRDGFLVGGAILYGLGYLVWSINAWQNHLGQLPAIQFQYLISGIIPALLIIIGWTIASTSAKIVVWLENYRYLKKLVPILLLIMTGTLLAILYIPIVSYYLFADRLWFETPFNLYTSLLVNIIIYIFLTLIMASVKLSLNNKIRRIFEISSEMASQMASKSDTKDKIIPEITYKPDAGDKTVSEPNSSNKTTNFTTITNKYRKSSTKIYSIHSFLLFIYQSITAILIFWYILLIYFNLYPHLPQVLGGPEPRCAYLDLVREQLAPASVSALAPSPATDKVIRSNKVFVYFSSTDYLLVRTKPTDISLYELRKDTVRAVEWCECEN